ncbi:MAG: STT3 domain-containing protein [Candidatus Aenigmatarchaeota archaeon]
MKKLKFNTLERHIFKIIEKIKIPLITTSILLLIIYLAFFVRLKTAYTDIPLDYDPWWFYRHAKDIVERFDEEHRFVLSAWDVLSYFPPGRPIFYDGYSYTIAISYILLRDYIHLNFEKYTVYFIAVFAALVAIPAFFLAKFLTKSNLAGLLAAFIITLSPAFLTVSMAGYVDSDVVYVFYTYLSILSTLLLFEKFFNEKIDFVRRKNLNKIIRLIPYILFTIVSYFLFAWNWNSAYYFLHFFVVFFVIYGALKIIILPLFKISNSKEGFIEILNLAIIFLIPIVLVEILTFYIENAFNTVLPHPIQTLINQYILAIKGGLTRALLVNVSVAELQTLNPFSLEGIKQIANRVGLMSFIFSILLIPLFLFKMLTKRFEWKEIFLISWLLISLYLISQGVRFSLLFATSLAIISSYTLISFYNIALNYIQKNRKDFVIFFNTFFFAFIFLFAFYYLDNAFKIANAMKGMEINENWRSALDFIKTHGDEYTLVATWWDPGHIIAGYTGMKVHADGAHCSWEACIPYNHDIRIQDMGRILTTSNETEAYEILKKYTRISQEDCKRVKNAFPELFNESICNITIKKVYFIASQDLIFKYYWPYYFSSCLRKYYPDNSICYTRSGIENFFFINKQAEGKVYSFFILNIQKSDINRNILVYTSQAVINNRVVDVDITIKPEIYENQTILVPYLMNRDVIKYLVYYPAGQPIVLNLENYGKKANVNAMVILDPSLQYLIFADSDLMNSMFTKMYFLNGIGLEKFKLVFNNPEVKIYEVNFEQ